MCGCVRVFFFFFEFENLAETTFIEKKKSI